MALEQQSAFPAPITWWETVLVERFLRIGADEDASPIRSLEITAETIAAAAGMQGVAPQRVETAFRAALLADRNLWSALREGRHRSATADVPNCFAYLAMTLLIDTLLQGDYSQQGQFRDRLRNWLGTTRSLMQLSGVAAMWRSLAVWLDNKADQGEPYRRLVLPPPRGWTHIGYTRRLSFPTRVDLRFLERVTADFHSSAPDPPRLIRAVDAAINLRGASWGMQTAFEEFRALYRAGAASTDHRFWRLVLQATRKINQTGPEEAVLELGFDEDARRSISVGAASNTTFLSPIDDLGTAMRSELIARSCNLAASTSRGITFFRQVGIARWHAQSEPPLSAAGIHVAFSKIHAHRLRRVPLSLVQSGDWLLTAGPVGQRVVDDILQCLQLNRIGREQLLSIALKGGVRVGSLWLGRKEYLPEIQAGELQVAVIRLAGQEEGPPITIRHGVLQSQGTVEGIYEISATAEADGDKPGWSRHARFVADAIPHQDLAGAAYEEPLVSEWISCDRVPVRASFADELAWAESNPAMADLLEAIYASGRTGLPEGEVIDLISRGTGGSVDSWSVLRSLHECGSLEARHRRRWRGRVWTLGAPTLAWVHGSVPGVVAQGAICASLEREFREVVSHMRGRPFRRLGACRWAPPLLGAADVEPDTLAARLGWQLLTDVAEPRPSPMSLEVSELVAEHHVLASSWDWNRRRFVTGATGPCEVSLTRWAHPGGRDHDIYRVRSAMHSSAHLTRNTAILTAHSIARIALFRIEDGVLLRTSNEGALPLEFARSLRLSALASGGSLQGGGYCYPLGGYDTRRIARALPGCIEGVSDDGSRSSSVHHLMAARRSGGRHRVRWANGAFTSDR